MRKFKTLFLTFSLWSCAFMANAQGYSEGVFILNEDWFGHNNSTINFLNTNTGEFDYLIIQENSANNGLSLGCTAQFGTIYGDNLYVISKQDQDPGEKAYRGGRVVIVDAKTMEIKKSIPFIALSNKGSSIADGRAFVGVNETKGYVGTSNGIYLLDLNTFEIGDCIKGSENPLITGDESNADGNGPLYNNQIGLMLRSHDYVFAIQQDKGVLVINAETDEVEKVIPGCFSTMAQSKDGNIWVGANTNKNHQTYPYGLIGEEWEGSEFLKIDPETLDTSSISMKLGGINQTWYAWTAGSLCASVHENALYFTYNSNKWSWFTTSEMYKYDIDKDEFSKIYDTASDGRYFYGGGIRINPLDDKIYTTLYRDNVDQSYWVYQMDNEGNVLNEYEPIQRYWFMALPIFPDVYEPLVSDFMPVSLNDMEPITIDLSKMASDKDNLDAAITKRIIDIDNEDLLTANIKGNKLNLTAKEGQVGVVNITVRFNSNGKIVDKELSVNVASVSTTIESEMNDQPAVTGRFGVIYIENIQSETIVDIYNLQGQLVFSQIISTDTIINDIKDTGIYVVRIGNQNFKISI